MTSSGFREGPVPSMRKTSLNEKKIRSANWSRRGDVTWLHDDVTPRVAGDRGWFNGRSMPNLVQQDAPMTSSTDLMTSSASFAFDGDVTTSWQPLPTADRVYHLVIALQSAMLIEVMMTSSLTFNDVTLAFRILKLKAEVANDILKMQLVMTSSSRYRNMVINSQV